MSKMVYNMYSKLNSNVKTSNMVSNLILQQSGVMQGSGLSPILSVIYINAFTMK